MTTGRPVCWLGSSRSAAPWAAEPEVPFSRAAPDSMLNRFGDPKGSPPLPFWTFVGSKCIGPKVRLKLLLSVAEGARIEWGRGVLLNQVTIRGEQCCFTVSALVLLGCNHGVVCSAVPLGWEFLLGTHWWTSEFGDSCLPLARFFRSTCKGLDLYLPCRLNILSGSRNQPPADFDAAGGLSFDDFPAGWASAFDARN